MSAAEDVARMLTLVPWLLERPGASLAEAAATFDVDERTIQRDLSHLDFCGLPGLGGGDLFDVELIGDRIVVQMADELRRPLRPTPREALRLVLTLDAVVDALGDELPALRSAVAKVRRALGIPEAVADVVPAEAGDVVAVVRGALRAGRRLLLTYQGRGDQIPQDRTVDPWALHVIEGAWYLQGHDHGAGDLRTFRLDRALAARLLAEGRSVPPPAQLPEPQYVPGPDDLEVVLHVSMPRGAWLRDALSIEDETPTDDGVLVELRTDAPMWVARLVLMAGGDVTVVHPDELRSTVAELAREALTPYGSAPVTSERPETD